VRNALALATLACLVISGCSSRDDGTTGTPADGMTVTSVPTTTTVPVTVNQTLACTTQAGLTGNANLNDGVGGCIMSDGVGSNTTVMALRLAAGCVSWYDTTPGDSTTEGEALVGHEYPKGTTFGVYCDATMAPNSESQMDVEAGTVTFRLTYRPPPNGSLVVMP